MARIKSSPRFGKNLTRDVSAGSKFWRGMAAASFAALILAGCGDSGAERQKEAAEIAKGIEDYLALIETPSQPIRIRHDKITVTPAEDGKSFEVAITGVRYGSEKEATVTTSATYKAFR